MPRIDPEISYHHFEKRDDIDELIRQRIDKLDRYCDHIDHCSVVVERPNAFPGSGARGRGDNGSKAEGGSGYRVRVALTVAPSHELVATMDQQDGTPGDDVRKIIRETFDTAERQLKKLVQKQRGDVKAHAGDGHHKGHPRSPGES